MYYIYTYRVSTEARRGHQTPWNRWGSCELPECGAGKQTMILCKSTQCFYHTWLSTLACLQHSPQQSTVRSSMSVYLDVSLAVLKSSWFTEYSRALVEQKSGWSTNAFLQISVLLDLQSLLLMPWLAWKITEIPQPFPTKCWNERLLSKAYCQIFQD